MATRSAARTKDADAAARKAAKSRVPRWAGLNVAWRPPCPTRADRSWSQNGSNPGRRSTVAYLIRAGLTKGVTMEALQKPGRIAGLWFIGTFVFSIPAVLLYDPVLNDADYIFGGGLDARISLGALFEILLAISNIATAVVFFPVLKRVNEAVALGYVASRIMESAIIVTGLMSLMTVVTLRDDFAGAGADSATLNVAGHTLVAFHDWTFLLGPQFGAGLRERDPPRLPDVQIRTRATPDGTARTHWRAAGICRRGVRSLRGHRRIRARPCSPSQPSRSCGRPRSRSTSPSRDIGRHRSSPRQAPRSPGPVVTTDRPTSRGRRRAPVSAPELGAPALSSRSGPRGRPTRGKVGRYAAVRR